MRKIGIIALLLVTVQSVSAQVSISASTSNGAGGQTVVQTDTIAGQRLWPDFHAVEVEGAMKVRFETADAEHPVGISYYANDFKAGKYVSKVENGVLKLRMQRSKEADSLQVTVRYNTLSAVKVSGAAGHFARKQGAAVRLNAYGGALVGRNEHYVGPVARPALAVLVMSAGNYRAVGSQANVMYAARSYHARSAERSARKGGTRSLALAGVCALLRLGRCVAHVYGKVNIPVILTASCKKRRRHYKRKQRSNDLFHALSSIRPAYAESYTYHII